MWFEMCNSIFIVSVSPLNVSVKETDAMHIPDGSVVGSMLTDTELAALLACALN